MKITSIYQVLNFLLLPFALLLGFTAFPMIIAALANATALLPLFMIVCIIIYIYCSIRFFNRGVKQQQICNKSLKDWIKVNAYVCIAFVLLMFVQGSVIAANPMLISDQLMADLAKQSNNSLPPQVNAALVGKMLKYVTYFMLFYSVVLSVHIFMSFKLIKTNNHLFQEQ